jgi:hypothetical protein
MGGPNVQIFSQRMGLIFITCVLLGSHISAQQAEIAVAQFQDGIPATWKTDGVDYTSSDGGKHHLDLKARGASLRHRDVIVWVDWMAGSNDPASHDSHMPIPSAIQGVQLAFSMAPILNPDGSKGINLIVLVSPDSVSHKSLLGTGSEPSIWADFDQIKQSHFPKELAGVVHYCLFAHDINVPGKKGTSGDSRGIGSYDFIVSLGSWESGVGNEDEQAGTFMHELGHNLGLQHGGADAISFKPNFLSVMNYFFQTDGLRAPPTGLRFDYSHFALADLNESDLDETNAMSLDTRLLGWSTLYFCPGQFQAIDPPVPINDPIDWNCDGIFAQHVAAHISGSRGSPALSILHGHDDWGDMSLTPAGPASGLAPVIPLSALNEVSLGEANSLPIPPVTGLSAVVSNSSVRVSWNRLPESRIVGYKVTKFEKKGLRSEFTTQQPFFVDTTSNAVRYEVHGLYAPHGFAALIQVSADGKSLLSIAGSSEGMPTVQVLDQEGLSALKKEAKALVQQFSKEPDQGQFESLASALRVQSSKVVLETKGSSVQVEGVK